MNPRNEFGMPETHQHTPIVLRSDNLIYFDVDETLINWKVKEDDMGNQEPYVNIFDPYMPDGEKTIPVIPHKRNIDLLKRSYGRGQTVVVWSAGGVFWAEAVVKALKLSKYVSLIVAKPTVYVDDKPMEYWSLAHVFLQRDLPEPI